MKTRNDFNKYGLAIMTGWNILLIVLILLCQLLKDSRLPTFPMTTKDILIITILAIVSVSCFCVSKKALNSE